MPNTILFAIFKVTLHIYLPCFTIPLPMPTFKPHFIVTKSEGVKFVEHNKIASMEGVKVITYTLL